MPLEKNNRFYKGQSMEGTFRFGDRLIIEFVPIPDIRLGEVVVYRKLNHNSTEEEVVHRVVGSCPNGLVVRGDNNLFADSTLVTEYNLLGRVSYVERHGKRIYVFSRRFGLLRARTLYACRHAMQWFLRFVYGLSKKYYHCLRDSGLILRFWQPSINKVRFMTANGPLIKYVCRNRSVAFYWEGIGRFKCRKPYDLVIRREK